MYATKSNQWGLGIGYKRSTIYGTNRHLLWITLGYTAYAWSWNKNPDRPQPSPNAAATG